MAKITKEELLTKFREMAIRCEEDTDDTEIQHGEADDLLIKYIDDDEITEAYDAIHKWYA